MKKLIYLLLPLTIKAQVQTSTLLNIYPVNTTPVNYQAQPGPVNNNVTQANYNDSLTAVIQLTWAANTPTSNVFAIMIENNYAPCAFTWQNIPTYVSFSNLTPISVSSGMGYYKFKFKLAGFSTCPNPSTYFLKIGGTANPSYQPSIPFTVNQVTTGIEELNKKEITKTERYNIMGEPDEHGLIEIIYYSDGSVKRTKNLLSL